MHNLAGDIRYAFRQFRLSPVFTLTAVLTLALGIGGTTAIFSLIHTVMLRSLPVGDPASLYRIGEGNDCCVEGGPQDKWGMYSYPFYQRLKQVTPEFSDLAAFQAGGWSFSVRRAQVDHLARTLHGEWVSGNYFSTLGIRAFTGRLLKASDDRAAAPPVAVLSSHVWRDSYGSDPAIIGSAIIVEGRPLTVVGIAPPGFFGETLRSDPPDLWMPLEQEPLVLGQNSLLRQPISAWLRVIGRLKPGATTSGMSAHLTSFLRQWLLTESGYPAGWIPEIKRLLPKQFITVVPAGSGVAVMKEDYGRSLQILLTVCGLVLLIACANSANLLLARSMARRGETSVRLAIGASQTRIISQSLTESTLLAIAGGIAGLVVAYAAGRLILALAFHGSNYLPISSRPSLPVLGFTFALSLVTGIIFGVAPAWFATRTSPVDALRGANRSTKDSSSFSRNALLVLQATLSVVLIAGASMLARSLNNLENEKLGFETKNRVTVNLNSPPPIYTQDHLDAVYRDLEERLQHVPGVERASLSLYNPFSDNWGEIIFVEGHPFPKMSEDSVASWDRVSLKYFDTLGQSLVRGRAFTASDKGASAPVAIVNQAFVKRFLPHEDPLARRFGIDVPENANTYHIVGIIRDAKYHDPQRPPRPMFFVPLAQHHDYGNDMLQKSELRSHFIENALLETRSDPGTLEPLLKKLFSDVDPNLTISSVRTMQQQVDFEFDQQRAVAGLAGLFGLVALVLAAIGLYGVTAYSVAQRTSEIGVRMALGATRANVMQLILQGAFRKVAFGLLLGIPLSIGAGRLLSAQLYGVASWDPIALGVAIGSLAVCAFLAAVIPANRAASLHPMRALRTE